MKTVFKLCLIAFFACPACMWAQTTKLSPKMELFKEYCLKVREGIGSQDIATLEDCLKEFNQKAYNATGGNFVYNGQTIALTKYDRFYKVDTLASVPMGNHLKFDPAYVDTLLATDLQPVALEEPTLLRSDGYDCMYIHQAIAAKGKCVYQAKGSGAKELFVVAENGGTINLVVKNPKNKVEVKDASSAGKPSAEVTWSMPRFSDYSIEVENTSDKDISVIIVTN